MMAKALYALVILIHVYIVVLEMVLWKRRAARVFRLPQALVVQTASMASNQGLYNLFLVAALVLGWILPDPQVASAFAIYGLACVAIAVSGVRSRCRPVSPSCKPCPLSLRSPRVTSAKPILRTAFKRASWVTRAPLHKAYPIIEMEM